MAEQNKINQISVGNNLYDINSRYWCGLEPSSKQDVLVSGSNIKNINGEPLVGGGNIDIKNCINVTYSQLKSLRDNFKLIPGSYYRITDYETIIKHSTAVSAGHNFDIIVLALNENTIYEDARVCDSNVPNDNTKTITSQSTILSDFQISSSTWQNLEPKNIPSGIKSVMGSDFTDYVVKYYSFTKNLNKGELSASVNWVSGTNKINIVGVDLIKNNTVISNDYHIGSTINTSHINNTYTVKVPSDGSYVIRFLIEGISDPITSSCKLSAINREYEYYFNNSNLNSWNIKYCLDNDTSRFNWADANNGKGVIYYLKDDYNNECHYDFKNILFNGYYTFSYTVDGKTYDGSVKYTTCNGNKIAAAYNSDGTRNLNGIIFKNTSSSSNCKSNIFEQDCENNVFGDSCMSNYFGYDCNNNTFGNNCQYNKFDDFCSSNKFNNYCIYNNFGVYCQSNTFGSYIMNVSFGKECLNNKFTNSESGGSNLEACRMIKFGDKCSGVNLYNTTGSSYSSNRWLQNISIANGMSGSIEVKNLNENRTKYITKNIDGSVCDYFESELAVNRRINHGTSDTNFALTPNDFHVWGEVRSLTLSLVSGQSDVANEYTFQFESGSTATTLTLPNTIKWVNGITPVILTNSVYQINILDNFATILEFNK